MSVPALRLSPGAAGDPSPPAPSAGSAGCGCSPRPRRAVPRTGTGIPGGPSAPPRRLGLHRTPPRPPGHCHPPRPKRRTAPARAKRRGPGGVRECPVPYVPCPVSPNSLSRSGIAALPAPLRGPSARRCPPSTPRGGRSHWPVRSRRALPLAGEIREGAPIGQCDQGGCDQSGRSHWWTEHGGRSHWWRRRGPAPALLSGQGRWRRPL